MVSLRVQHLQLLIPPDATSDPVSADPEIATASGTPSAAPVSAFQIDSEATILDILAPGAAVPHISTVKLPVFAAETDPVLARALAAMEATMKEVPESAVAAVTRAIAIGSSSRVTYADLAGVSLIAKELDRVVTMPLKRPDFFMAYGLDPPRGVLMYGPPGSGKTQLACAAAAKAGATMMVRRWASPCFAHPCHSALASQAPFRYC